MISLPKYKCHKVVRAAKIIDIDNSGHNPILIFDNGLSHAVDFEWGQKHNPKVGGYFVLYEGGYASWSPAAQFENGYTLVEAL